MKTGTHTVEASVLRKVRAFSALSDHSLQLLAAAMTARRFEPREVVVAAGDPSRSLHVVLAGRVRVTTVAASGRMVTYDLLPTGEMFGEIGAIDGLPRTATVSAESEAVVASIPSSLVRDLVVSAPDFGLALLERMARLSRHLVRQVFLHNAYKVKGRVIAEYLAMDELAGGNWFELTDRDLASRVGTTRPNATNLRRELLCDGLISWSDSHIRVERRAELAALLPSLELA